MVKNSPIFRISVAVWLFGLSIYIMNSSYRNEWPYSVAFKRASCQHCNIRVSKVVHCPNKTKKYLPRAAQSIESLANLVRDANITEAKGSNIDWRSSANSRLLPKAKRSPRPDYPTPISDDLCAETITDHKWTGDFMWEELTDSIGSCCSRCHQRHGCVAFSYIDSGCYMFERVAGSVPDPGAMSSRLHHTLAPPDCRTLGTPCACPESTWATLRADDMMDRATACSLLRKMTVLAGGDSLVRDVWTTLALWLLVADGVDGVLRAGANHHAACMVCAWKFLAYLGVKQELEARGLLVEGPPETYTLSACGGQTRMIFLPAPLFQDLGAIAQAAAAEPGGAVDLLIVGAGVHEMVNAGDDESAVRGWARSVAALARSGAARRTVIVGTHARIAALAPPQYRDYAEGPQGNAKIRAWNAAIAAELRSARAEAGDHDQTIGWVDPYRITAELVRTWRSVPLPLASPLTAARAIQRPHAHSLPARSVERVPRH